MSDGLDWLPPLVLLPEYGGNWDCYLEAVYQYFVVDFIRSLPTFPGRRMKLKRYPITRGKEATFWHFIQEGKIEEDRIPDFRRCERIRWPRPIINAALSSRVRCWRNMRHTSKGTAQRIVIALPDFSYVVVLDDHGDYVLPWTAYWVEYNHQRQKLKKEYEAAPEKLGPLS
jgi:hypothetical protein